MAMADCGLLEAQCRVQRGFRSTALANACFRLLKPDSAESDDIRILRDIEQYYSTQIDEMPMNVADLI